MASQVLVMSEVPPDLGRIKTLLEAALAAAWSSPAPLSTPRANPILARSPAPLQTAAPPVSHPGPPPSAPVPSTAPATATAAAAAAGLAGERGWGRLCLLTIAS